MKVFLEEPYCSSSLLNGNSDMVRITIHLPLLQWIPYKQKFIEMLHKLRLQKIKKGGME